MLFWIFATPYNFPGQRTKKDSPLDILRRRFASGEITKDEYMERKEILEKDMTKAK
jgi:putative membrane protein